MFLTKKGGVFVPSYPADYEEAQKVKDGEEIKATRARNILFHRKGMALLKLAFDNQDKFTDFNIYRQIITMKAGFVVWVEGKDGQKMPFAESLSFDSMGAKKFEEWYNAVLTVVCKEIGLTSEEIQTNLISFM